MVKTMGAGLTEEGVRASIPLILPVGHVIIFGQGYNMIKEATECMLASYGTTGKVQQSKERAEGFWLRRTVESIQIRKATPNMNLDSGLLLHMVWNPILKPPSPSPLSPICLVNAWSHFLL